MDDEQEILKLKRYCQEIIDNPHPFEDQPYLRKNGKMWCNDWRIIEVLKYFFNGDAMYRSDPPPNRLKNNDMWNKEDIIKEAQGLLRTCKNADGVIQHFRSQRECYGKKSISS